MRSMDNCQVSNLLAAAVPVAVGHDCVMDPWYRLGSGDIACGEATSFQLG